jgi:hypothetical protein
MPVQHDAHLRCGDRLDATVGFVQASTSADEIDVEGRDIRHSHAIALVYDLTDARSMRTCK